MAWTICPRLAAVVLTVVTLGLGTGYVTHQSLAAKPADIAAARPDQHRESVQKDDDQQNLIRLGRFLRVQQFSSDCIEEAQACALAYGDLLTVGTKRNARKPDLDSGPKPRPSRQHAIAGDFVD